MRDSSLDLCYLNGDGLGKDEAAGRGWLDKAAALGDGPAKERLLARGR